MNTQQQLQKIKKELSVFADKHHATHSQKFFKTAPGEYGEGDVFIGVRVPQIRTIARQYKNSSVSIIRTLIISSIHEERMLALILMVNQYKKADNQKQKELYNLYLAHTAHINNWDLVDISAPHIIGEYVFTHKNEEKTLKHLAKSNKLWERRIAMIACFYYIRQNAFDFPLMIAEGLLYDTHDLMHKAVGWMLREIGKRDEALLEKFLQTHNYASLPRTLLRYAIERLSHKKRKSYMKK